MASVPAYKTPPSPTLLPRASSSRSLASASPSRGRAQAPLRLLVAYSSYEANHPSPAGLSPFAGRPITLRRQAYHPSPASPSSSRPDTGPPYFAALQPYSPCSSPEHPPRLPGEEGPSLSAEGFLDEQEQGAVRTSLSAAPRARREGETYLRPRAPGTVDTADRGNARQRKWR
ncbi:hypothetical protein BV25DRAFT_1916883 [Artomyces pyxidatus]|uniref:Uncharacterized protein n=1 Tax=Artomyces pyxidatus TaxID=48021 RepID=A0ACB8SYQ1_9AGAM|nr:hypothetical protein BV25DRAFT_1916883 [Artomyces pyxidatus]